MPYDPIERWEWEGGLVPTEPARTRATTESAFPGRASDADAAGEGAAALEHDDVQATAPPGHAGAEPGDR